MSGGNVACYACDQTENVRPFEVELFETFDEGLDGYYTMRNAKLCQECIDISIDYYICSFESWRDMKRKLTAAKQIKNDQAKEQADEQKD
jgi:hypothetical protein